MVAMTLRNWVPLSAALLLLNATTTIIYAAPNGIGADPDGDSNPATDTRAFARTGDEAEQRLDPPFKTITFETPPGKNGDIIRGQYNDSLGVKFSRGLSRESCEGQQYFSYDTNCTYRAAPSGKYVAVYRDEYRRALRVRFERPVCATALAAYPAGGSEGERFQITLQPYKDDETKLKAAKVKFTWTKNTFRWRNMVGAYFDGATRVDVSIKSLDNPTANIPLLIDDLSFVEEGCEAHLDEVKDASEI